MTRYWAKVEGGIVTNVIVAEQDFIDSHPAFGGSFVETFKDGSQRKNYAGIGMEYDSVRDAFIPEKPFPSWTLNETTCDWDPPIAMPDDGKYYKWNEDTGAWEE
jgi:hypothetical protein